MLNYKFWNSYISYSCVNWKLSMSTLLTNFLLSMKYSHKLFFICLILLSSANEALLFQPWKLALHIHPIPTAVQPYRLATKQQYQQSKIFFISAIKACITCKPNHSNWFSHIGLHSQSTQPLRLCTWVPIPIFFNHCAFSPFHHTTLPPVFAG